MNLSYLFNRIPAKRTTVLSSLNPVFDTVYMEVVLGVTSERSYLVISFKLFKANTASCFMIKLVIAELYPAKTLNDLRDGLVV